MQQTKTQFGGGFISPQLREHLKLSKEAPKAPPKTEFGGGLIAPTVVAHCKRTQTQFGGGLVHPRLARSIAR